ncbi:hypothetical protein CYMTET_6004 [Cymbomonas tetramitiformis]|uniref:Reverse transcriptase RNase H-like domain-containing protein n=1 Tax=Cymbomonas tetramitiformis TaxID=36881 RepID=A0AAE0LIH9_9CHLO|nr:hypothetical protein CYMTET_6004 [Cymbomonas tetramitiformis]
MHTNMVQQCAFEELKTALSSAPVLALPDIKKAADGTAPFLVQTDASGVALGGVLMQDTGEGLKVIAYESRQFSAAEQNYHTGERELCALHHCTTVTWRHYLIFSEFGLQGDHRPLEWLMSPGRELSRRQARWYMDLVEVGVPRMEYVKGALLLVPDALSRRADYAVKTPRDGLKEAGVVDVKTDLPKDPLSALDAEDLFEDSPPAARPQWLAAIEAWVDGAETLQRAERAIENYSLSSGEEPDPTLAADVAVRRSARLQKQPEVSTVGPEPRASHHPEDARSQLRQEALALVKRGPGRPPKHPAQQQEAPAPKTQQPDARSQPRQEASALAKRGPGRPWKHPAQQQEAPALKTRQQEARSQLRQEAPTLKLQQSADRQGWKVRNEVYQRLQTLYGKFDIDVNWGTMDDSDTQWRGKHVWCTPPYSSSDTTVVEAMLQKIFPGQSW